MMVVRPLILRWLSELTMLFLHRGPSSVNKSVALDCPRREEVFGQGLPLCTQHPGIIHPANFHIHQSCFFIVFWAASNWTPLCLHFWSLNTLRQNLWRINSQLKFLLLLLLGGNHTTVIPMTFTKGHYCLSILLHTSTLPLPQRSLEAFTALLEAF